MYHQQTVQISLIKYGKSVVRIIFSKFLLMAGKIEIGLKLLGFNLLPALNRGITLLYFIRSGKNALFYTFIKYYRQRKRNVIYNTM